MSAQGDFLGAASQPDPSEQPKPDHSVENYLAEMPGLSFEHVATFNTNYHRDGERVFIHARRDGAIAMGRTGMNVEEIGRVRLYAQWLPKDQTQEWNPLYIHPYGGGWKDIDSQNRAWTGYFTFDKKDYGSAFDSIAWTVHKLLEEGRFTPVPLNCWDFKNCLSSNEDSNAMELKWGLRDEKLYQAIAELKLSRAQTIAITNPWFLEMAGIELPPEPAPAPPSPGSEPV
jgi:hypothetical protein